MSSNEPQWLVWAKRIQAIAQTGLTYATDKFDLERYHELSELAADITARHSDVPFERLRSLFAAETGYPTPKVDVRGVVFRDGQILLVQELSDGLWTLPGGWADVNESAAEAVTREVAEEAGYSVVPRRLLALYDRSKHPHEPVFFHHVYKVFFECEIVGRTEPNANLALETLEVGFYSPESLPSLSISRITSQQIMRLFELHNNPELPPDFD